MYNFLSFTEGLRNTYVVQIKFIKNTLFFTLQCLRFSAKNVLIFLIFQVPDKLKYCDRIKFSKLNFHREYMILAHGVFGPVHLSDYERNILKTKNTKNCNRIFTLTAYTLYFHHNCFLLLLRLNKILLPRMLTWYGTCTDSKLPLLFDAVSQQHLI